MRTALLPRRRLLYRAASAAGLALLAPALSELSGCGRQPIKGRPVPASSTVLALGDSLTYGTGATPETAYPAALEPLTGWQVINAGVPGDTAAQGVARLPALLEEHRPALVLIGLGGNDFLRRLPEADTRAALTQACQSAAAAGAQVLLIAVPRPTLMSRVSESLDDHPLYGDLSEKLRVPLHRRGWAEVLQDPALRSDAIHANAEGYRRFAAGLLASLRAVEYLA